MNPSTILILYDDMLISSTELRSSLHNIFKFIQSHNSSGKTELLYKEDTNSFTLNNKYYSCCLSYTVHPISSITDIKVSEYEGVIVFLHEVSIKNKTFNEIADMFNDNDNYASCVVLFNESRDVIENCTGYMELIETTLEKHFEIICDCANVDSFNGEDGPGALSMSLHSANWKCCDMNKEKKIENVNVNLNNCKEDAKIKENKKKGYDLMNDQEEIDKMFSKIKEMKLINSTPGISDEERRNNAEKAIMMMAEMLGLDEEEEEDDK